MTLANIELLIILLLVLAQARDAWVKRDRAEEIRAAMTEGMRKGYETHADLTRKSQKEIAEMYAIAYETIDDICDPKTDSEGQA